VADIAGILFMYFSACAGVFIDAPSLFGGSWFSVVDCAFDRFLHGVTRRTVSRTLITHMRINHLNTGTLTYEKIKEFPRQVEMKIQS
jgi:hypothetical protein